MPRVAIFPQLSQNNLGGWEFLGRSKSKSRSGHPSHCYRLVRTEITCELLWLVVKQDVGEMKSPHSAWYLQPVFLFSLISAVNLLNYIDRGIIPGATIEINDFIQSDLDTDKPDVYLGLLQSSFIIGFMAGKSSDALKFFPSD